MSIATQVGGAACSGKSGTASSARPAEVALTIAPAPAKASAAASRPWALTGPPTCVAMDMVYKPLKTPFLARAETLGLATVDGLEMLVRQAVPSFEAFFGRPPPAEADVRALALAVLEESA